MAEEVTAREEGLAEAVAAEAEARHDGLTAVTSAYVAAIESEVKDRKDALIRAASVDPVVRMETLAAIVRRPTFTISTLELCL